MERKYRVFISSSFEDLKKHREALILATLRAGHIPFGMEMLHGSVRPTVEVIEKEISKSDVVAVLVGARLGSAIDNGNESYTELEYDLAEKYKLPIIAFLLEESSYKEAQALVPLGDKERNTQQQLDQFRERVKLNEGRHRIVDHFHNEDIGGLRDRYSQTLGNCISSLGGQGGWVPGVDFDRLSTQIRLDPAVKNNPFFRDFAQSLSRFEKLTIRTNVDGVEKAAIASFFWKRYFAKLHDKRIEKLFFESGSSIAFVSRAFIGEVRRQTDWFYEQRMNQRLRILTNNILTYLDFLLQQNPWRPMEVRLTPVGPVSDDYGGTYGNLSSAVQRAAPSVRDPVRPLHKDAAELVSQMRSDLNLELSNGLILMTASGVDTRPPSEGAPYPGPHVGSYPNMLLKRTLLSLPYPKVLFLSADKWGYDFRPSNCYAVCDPSFPWHGGKTFSDGATSPSPLCVALAAKSQSTQQALAEDLGKHGFTDIDLEEPAAGSGGPWSLIAANPEFSKYFD